MHSETSFNMGDEKTDLETSLYEQKDIFANIFLKIWCSKYIHLGRLLKAMYFFKWASKASASAFSSSETQRQCCDVFWYSD